MKNQNSEIDKPLEKTPMYYIMGIIVGFLIVSTFLSFINLFYLINEFGYCGLYNQNELGDAIGGLTAPFINSMTGVLIYLSFREQKRANDNQYDILETERKRSDLLISYDRILSLIKDLDIDFKNVPFKHWSIKEAKSSPEWIDTWGLEALEKFKMKDKFFHEKQYSLNRPFLIRLSNNLTAFSFIIDLITKHVSIDRNDNSQHILLIKTSNVIDYYKHILLEINKSFDKYNIDELKDEIKLVSLQLKRFENDIYRLSELEFQYFVSQAKTKASESFK
jgi:hypothetical protein